MRDISYRVALGGIVTALCIGAMFFAGIIPALYLVLPMIAGVFMMIIATEISIGWAFLTYMAVSILSFFVTFDKEASLIFIMLFGHYPVIRFYLKKINVRFLRYTIKFLIFNLCAVAYFYMTVYVFGLDQMLDEMGELGRYGSYIMLFLCNVIFVLYDINLDLCYNIYKIRLMPKLRRKK
ncbi:MAG: hypothetical protein K2J08_08665 [Ruminococcus sp.]|nr:hypothetical protein [Ruminococcus sp.]